MRLVLVAAFGGLLGCNRAALPGQKPPQDLSFQFGSPDLLALNGCGDYADRCYSDDFTPPFPLQSDPGPDPNESDEGLTRDQSGDLILGVSNPPPDALWLANTDDWSRGTLSRIDPKTVREVARYFTVTCRSRPTGSEKACDGTSGCCAADSYPEWQNRANSQPGGPAQQVLLLGNSPSRTAVDSSGDVWVANRAFGGQSSVTKIAALPSRCTDRNGNGRIDTSSDVDGDGVIATDCNGDGAPDDLAQVQAKPCSNGRPQEFFGLDDECVLFTTNTNDPTEYGRPLALGPGAKPLHEDAWAGGYNNGRFFRIDATTGLTKAGAVVDQCRPYGLTIDASGIAWAAQLGDGVICYFDTANPTSAGKTRQPQLQQVSPGAYGITLDRDQNVWLADFSEGGAFRYTPDRSNGFANLGKGFFSVVSHAGGLITGNAGGMRGIAADSRSQNDYFVWVASDAGWIVRIPASQLPVQKVDRLFDGSAYPAVRVAGSDTIGAGVDRDQNVWSVSLTGSVATRIHVDGSGTMTAPDILSAPKAGARCPAGDRCAYQDTMASSPDPYTYSDFTGFGLRNFTNPSGRYGYLVEGCSAHGGGTTHWLRVTWQADVPNGTTLTARARSGLAPGSPSFGAFADPAGQSPLDFDAAGLAPNQTAGYDWLEVQLDFGTSVTSASPRLEAFSVFFECT